MKMKLFWLPCLMLFLGAICVSCGSDNDDQTDDSGKGGTEVKGDYTATTSVKTVTLKVAGTGLYEITCYEDFNRKYVLRVLDGHLCLFPYSRQAGDWNNEYDARFFSYNNKYDLNNLLYIEEVGKVKDISTITTKVEIHTEQSQYYPSFQPEHGYAAVFKTEDDELKYLRVFVSGYTLTESGGIATATLQYQLY